MSTSLATRPRRRRLGSLIALATAAILAACGGGNGGGEAAAETQEAAAETQEAAPETSQAAAETSQPAPEVPTGDGTSLDAPLPAGTELELTEEGESVWKIQVTGVNWDTSDPDWAESLIGTYAIIDLKVTRTGANPGDPYIGFYWDLFDLDGNFLDESMNMTPDHLCLVGELAEGESATGQLIFNVPEGMNQGILSFWMWDGDEVFVVAN
jgi:hypothetical protein